MRVDKFYERRIKWDALLADPNSEAYSHLSYEAVRAVSSPFIAGLERCRANEKK